MSETYTLEDQLKIVKSLCKPGVHGRVEVVIVDGQIQTIKTEVTQRKTDKRQFKLIEE
jgi:hypothetical protein